MIAYKFLSAGRVGPFSQFPWPEPDVWVRTDAETTACRRGIHACRTRDLPWWLAAELWRIELDGEVRAAEHKVVAPAGRLRSRIEGWTTQCAHEYAQACAWRARDRVVEALTRVEHTDAADRLAGCTTLGRVLVTARRVAEDVPDSSITRAILGDGQLRALAGAPAMGAYIAAHAARRLEGPSGYADERAWQSRWLVERLGLEEGV
jgi:hypothetical protein